MFDEYSLADDELSRIEATAEAKYRAIEEEQEDDVNEKTKVDLEV